MDKREFFTESDNSDLGWDISKESVVKDIEVDNFDCYALNKALFKFDSSSAEYKCILEILNKFSLAAIKFSKKF